MGSGVERHQGRGRIQQLGRDGLPFQDYHGPQGLGRSGENLPQTFGVRADLGFRQDHGQGQFHQRGRLEQHVPLLVEDQKHGLAAQVDGSADVFPAVDAVPGRPDDFRHIGPEGVEAFARKDAAIAGAGNRNLAGFRLVPGGADDLRGVVIIAQVAVLGV